MKKAIWAILAIVLVYFIVSSVSKKPSEMSDVETGPIKIGFVGPLTGDAAEYGEVVKNGVMLAAKKINADGGINGRQVEVIYEDGKCNGKDSLSAAQKLVSTDGVKFIVNGDCSGGILGSAQFLIQSEVLTLASIATNPDITSKFGGSYILRNAQNDAVRGVALADYANKNHKKAAIITEQTDYAKGIKNTFVAQAKVNGLNIVADEEFITDTKDFRSIVTKIKALDPDVILINPQTGAAFARIATQARQLGIKAAFIGSEFNGTEVIKPETEGTVVSVAPGLVGEKGKAYIEAYKVEYGKEPNYAYYSGAGYDNLMLFAEGIKQYGYDASKVKDWLYELKSYDGTIGTYSFDSNGDVVGIEFLMQKLVNGKFVELK